MSPYQQPKSLLALVSCLLLAAHLSSSPAFAAPTNDEANVGGHSRVKRAALGSILSGPKYGKRDGGGGLYEAGEEKKSDHHFVKCKQGSRERPAPIFS